MRFVNLHCHTNASIGDALSEPKEYINYVISQGGNALAITDHGSMNMLPQALLYQEELKSKGTNFRLFHGCEIYYIESLKEWQKLYKEKQGEKKSKTLYRIDRVV